MLCLYVDSPLALVGADHSDDLVDCVAETAWDSNENFCDSVEAVRVVYEGLTGPNEEESLVPLLVRTACLPY